MTKLHIDLFSGTLEVDGEEGFVRSVYDDFKGKLLAVQVGSPGVLNTATTVQPHIAGSTAISGGQTADADQTVPHVATSVDTRDHTGAVEPQLLGGAMRSAKAGSKRRTATLPSLIKDLDLSDVANDFSLTDFYAAKSPQTAMESNVVFVYYLQQIAQVARISVDHIYTCYKFVNVKYPNALKQSLADTSSRKNWLDTSAFDDIRLSTPGENFVEHDLPHEANSG